MFLLKLLEYCIGKLLYRRRGYDALAFFKSRAFSQHPKPSITITSPECDDDASDTTAQLSHDHSMFGAGRFPQLQWESADASIEEYLLLTEDPDAPFGKPNVHGIYLLIPPHVTGFTNDDLQLVGEDEDGVKVIKAGYRVGKNRRDRVYIPARPVLGHGPHRYFFILVGLTKKLDSRMLSKVPTKEEVEEAIVGKVAGWGMWEATFEQQW